MSKYYRRPDGLYESIRTIDGKRKAFRGKTVREVDKKILEYTREQERGRKLPEVADDWQREHDSEIAESTRRTYAFAVKRLKEAFPGYIRDIKPLDVKRHIVSLEKEGRAAGSISVELAVIKQVFSFAVLQGDIDVSPATEVHRSKGLPKKERTALTEAQEASVVNSALHRSADDWLLGYFLLQTGMRRGEALAVTYSDVDRKAGVIHVTKKVSYATGKAVLEDRLKSANGKRDVPLLPQLANVLPKDRAGLIFPSKNGGFMVRSEFERRWKTYCRQTGLSKEIKLDDGSVKEEFPITAHCFRHSYATICFEAGIDSRSAAEFLGDTPQIMEGVYTHLRQDKKQAAVDALAEHFGNG